VPYVSHTLEETSKTYEKMKMTAKKLCKNRVYFKVRKGNPYCSLIKQKVPETYSCGTYGSYKDFEASFLVYLSEPFL